MTSRTKIIIAVFAVLLVFGVAYAATPSKVTLMTGSMTLLHGTLTFGVPAASSAFSPANIAGLQVWLKADALVGLSDGDSVATWTDSSGNGYNLGATTYTKPVYKTNILNGKPVVRFSGTNDIYNGTQPSISQPYTTFIVGRFSSLAPTPMTDGGDGISRSSCVYYNAFVGLGVDSIFAGSLVNGTTISAGSWYQWTCEFNGASSKLYRNAADTGLSGNPGASGLTGLTIGSNARTGGSDYMPGDVAEIIIYDSVLSSTDRAKIESYLNSKYAVY